MSALVESTLKRIQNQKGVMGIIVVNPDGIPIRSDLDNSTTLTYVNTCCTLATLAKSTVRDMDPQNDLSILRVRSRKYEIMIAPCEAYLLIVIQNGSE
jgi:dynein light chain roadblock-type